MNIFGIVITTRAKLEREQTRQDAFGMYLSREQVGHWRDMYLDLFTRVEDARPVHGADGRFVSKRVG